MTDLDAFEVGDNVARHAGQGRLPERADPAHPVRADDREGATQRPLLIVPPWINKFYILDLRPENSFISGRSTQGYTVFVISWVNPDEQLADKSFEDYMREGPLAALDAIEKATGEREVNVHRLLHRRHAAGGDARLHGGDRRRPDQGLHLLRGAGRLLRSRRDLGVFIDEDQIADARAADGASGG